MQDGMSMTADDLITAMNDDEKFYRDYFEASRKPATLKKFLAAVNLNDARRRHLNYPGASA